LPRHPATPGRTAFEQAQATARQNVWALAGEYAPDPGTDASAPLIIDLDATLVTAHSEKEHAAPTFKRGFGFHPLLAFVDHGQAGTGEPLHLKLRPGNAGSNTAADHITVLDQALTQIPDRYRHGHPILVRADGAGCTKDFEASGAALAGR
jgi:Transposase DDE domain group 1